MTELAKKVARYFPYDNVRPFQDKFVETVFEAIEKGGSALIEGSNGLGKTIATLSACLPKAVEQNLKILYVARTHRQHDRVVEELKAISRKQRISGISIKGRHEMCLNNVVARHALDARAVMEVCEMLKTRDRCPYFRNIEENPDEYSEIQQHITFRPYKASEIQKICRVRGFCTYELVKASLAEVNVIALSYLYVFDPAIRKAFLKNLDAPLHKIILIVDEAHNLPETAIEIASSSLSLFAIKQAELEAKKFGYEEVKDFAKFVRSQIERLMEKIGKEALVSPEVLIELVREKADVGEPLTFFEHLHEIGSSLRRSLLAEGKYPRSFIHGMSEFLLRWVETAEEQSFVNVISKYMSRTGVATAKLEIVSLDPSKITAPVFSSVRSSIVMSGTLQPLEAYTQISKLPENTIKSVVPSPFPKEHILPLVCCGVTTAMEKRTPPMYNKIIKRIQEVSQNTPANIGVFTASFEVLQALRAEKLEKALDKPVFHEHKGMTSKENETLVARFKVHAKHGGAVLLGVQGGRSSEGVDYPGDQMNSVAIVGVPYAEPTPKVRAQIDYFEKRFSGLGREYGYILPAMKKASQVAGRPIRSLEDKGAMIFLDHRFATVYCQHFLPSWIRNSLKILPDKDGVVAWELSRFFRKVC
ncbi:MAG: DNA repair helicase [Candidatus Bathyarchaeota archaeon]|nr:DNA repair helicase [Candidatus Bathyarchaeota archaeon]MDH5787293.1 DNA repair helicase [Candidatus Bathyarchaeota archaeon]